MTLTVASAQFGRQADRGYGAPPVTSAPQPQYSRIDTTQDQLSNGQHSGDHQGLDWLLESVPGQPGTDYPIYSQEDIGQFTFDCNGQVEGGEDDLGEGETGVKRQEGLGTIQRLSSFLFQQKSFTREGKSSFASE